LHDGSEGVVGCLHAEGVELADHRVGQRAPPPKSLRARYTEKPLVESRQGTVARSAAFAEVLQPGGGFRVEPHLGPAGRRRGELARAVDLHAVVRFHGASSTRTPPSRSGRYSALRSDDAAWRSARPRLPAVGDRSPPRSASRAVAP